MVGKGAVALVLLTGATFALALRKDGPSSRTSDGNLTISVQPIGLTFLDVIGQGPIVYELGAVVTVEGTVTEGDPLPDMLLELSDHGAPIDSGTQTLVPLNTFYQLVTTITDTGGHDVQGRMVLTNDLGSVEYFTASIQFRIGKRPAGSVIITTEQAPLLPPPPP